MAIKWLHIEYRAETARFPGEGKGMNTTPELPQKGG
jgi:hypothetical protein